MSPCRLRDPSSRLSWRESSFLTAMSQNQSAQTSDFFSQDVFNQLFDMLDQWVNTTNRQTSCCKCKNIHNRMWRLKKNVSPMFQICHSFSPAHWAELQRQSNWWLCRKHHSDQYGLHNHARARWDTCCKYVGLLFKQNTTFLLFFTSTIPAASDQLGPDYIMNIQINMTSSSSEQHICYLKL